MLLSVPILALNTAKPSQVGQTEYSLAIERDLAGKECLRYATLPISELTEPPYKTGGGTCWHLYTSRLYHLDAKLPYTMEVYYARLSSDQIQTLLILCAGFALLAIVASGALYGVGWTIAWVRRGFAT